SVRVRAAGVSREARAAMAKFGELDDSADGALVIKGIDRERIPELVSAVVASGARVYAVEPQHESLEERFLSLLGKSHDGGARRGAAGRGRLGPAASTAGRSSA